MQSDNALAIQVYRETFFEAYQSGSKLGDRTYREDGIEALIKHMPVFGSVDTNQRGAGEDVTIIDTPNARPFVELTPWHSFGLVDKQVNAITNVDLMRGKGMMHGKAVARQMDEPIIEALKAFSSTAYSRPDMTAANYGSLTSTHAQAMTARTAGNSTHVIPSKTKDAIVGEDIAAMKATLMGEDFDVDEQDVTFVYDAIEFDNMAKDNTLSSFDFLQQAAGRDNVTATSRFGMIYGAMPIAIGNAGRRAGHGRLPKGLAFMFVRNALALGVGTTENLAVMDWIPMKRSTLVGGECNAGACRLQNAGIVALRYADPT